MTASTTDSVKWAALDSNIGSGVVGDPAAIEAALDNIRTVVDQNASEINTNASAISGKVSKSGDAMTGDLSFGSSNGLLGSGATSTTQRIWGFGSGFTEFGIHFREAGANNEILLAANGSLTTPTVSIHRAIGINLFGTYIMTGTGSPEGVKTGPVGSLYLRTDGAAGTTLYKKTSGTGNTGWTAS